MRISGGTRRRAARLSGNSLNRFCGFLQQSAACSSGMFPAEMPPKTRNPAGYGWVLLNFNSTFSIASWGTCCSVFRKFIFPFECCDYGLLLRFSLLTC